MNPEPNLPSFVLSFQSQSVQLSGVVYASGNPVPWSWDWHGHSAERGRSLCHHSGWQHAGSCDLCCQTGKGQQGKEHHLELTLCLLCFNLSLLIVVSWHDRSKTQCDTSQKKEMELCYELLILVPIH